MAIKSISLAAIALILSTSVNGATISTNFVKNDSVALYSGSAFDASTGKYYERNYTNNTIYVFNNKADFDSNTIASTITPEGGSHGTYFEVINGKIYSRSDNSTSSVSVWDANTGLKEASQSFASMGGLNVVHTFNWGGYSGVNFMEDQGNLYLMGKNLSGGWQINELDSNLNILSTSQYSKETLGYSFIINNTLFSSDSYDSNHINYALDLLTNTEMVVDFTLDGMGALYMTNLNYEGISDTLYLHDRSGEEVFSIDNASIAFGVSAVPVPAAVWLFGSGLIGLIGIARRKKA